MCYLIANKKGLDLTNNIIWAVIIASGLSSLYGIVQSYGIDIISWSLDPAMRVFGSINNPVHYCAIMGMSIPVIIGKLFFLIDKKDSLSTKYSHFIAIIFYYIIIGLLSQFFVISKNSLLWVLFYIVILGIPYIIYTIQFYKNRDDQLILNVLFNSLTLVIYATYLSYSRATWISLTAAIGLMFTITLLTKMKLTTKEFLIITFGCLFLTTGAYLAFIFNLYTTSLTTLGLLSVILVSACILILWPFKTQNLLVNLSSIACIIIAQFFYTHWVSTLLLIGYVGSAYISRKKEKFNVATKLIAFIILLMNIQFISSSFIYVINIIVLIIGIYLNEQTNHKYHAKVHRQIFMWKFLTIGLIGFIIVSPRAYTILSNVFTDTTPSKDSISLIQQASDKINSFQNIAIEGSARTSMWKSSFPWIRDNALFGTGLDTIKFYFPKYRRPEYGKLEGGHNFTPDRLHNEYLNTLATKGVLGFVSFYIVFIGGTIISLLLFIKKDATPQQFLIVGLIGGSLVYLGQVLFNFGVVATLIYFYLFLSLGVGIKTNNENN